jgi:hypothetical protein
VAFLGELELSTSISSQQYFSLRTFRLSYQPPASSTFLSEQISHKQPASSTFISEQTSTSHQPPAKRTGLIQYYTEREEKRACSELQKILSVLCLKRPEAQCSSPTVQRNPSF